MRIKTFARAQEEQDTEGAQIYRSGNDSEEAYVRNGSRNIDLTSPEALSYLQKYFPSVYGKFKVSRPEDAVEREAERIADEVAAKPLKPLRAATSADSADTSESSGNPDGTDAVHPFAPSSTPLPGTAPPQPWTTGSTMPGGMPLPRDVRESFESKLRQDLSQVRVHIGGEAAVAAREIHADAFTVGRDIVFGAGEFSPGTPRGNRLIAHELAHVGQKRGPAAVNRYDGQGGTSGMEEQDAMGPAEGAHGSTGYSPPAPQAPPPPPKPPGGVGLNEQERKVIQQMDYLPVLKTLRDRVKEAVSNYDAAAGQQMGTGPGIGFAHTYGLRRPWDVTAGGALQSHGMQVENAHSVLQEALALVGLESENEIDTIESRFLATFQAKSLEVAHHLLDESEYQAKGEEERYRAVADDTCDVALGKLQAFAAELAELQEEVGNARVAAYGRDVMKRNVFLTEDTNILGEMWMARTAGDDDEIAQEKQKAFDDRKNALAAEMPILGVKDLNFRALAEMDHGRLKAALVEKAGDVVTSIASAREKLNPESVWELPPVIQQTKALMGLESGGVAAQVVDGKFNSVARNQMFIDLFLAAAAIALGIVAAVASGGTSLLAAGAYVSAMAGMGLLGGVQAYRSIERYGFESATSGTAIGNVRAINNKDPSVAWVVLDIAFAAVDAGQAVKAFAKLAQAARAINAISAAAKAGEAVDTVEALERFRKAAAGVGLGEGFVNRVMDSAQEMVESGLSGTRRELAVQSHLLSPDVPGFQSLVDGNPLAMKSLLRRHGNWERLQGFLLSASKAGGEGAETSKDFQRISSNLSAYRNKIVNEMNEKFGAKPLGSASSKPESDFDLSTYGISSGEDMIRAEAYMAANFGENWSEALRMNFYTDAQRLAGYAIDSLTLGQGAGMPAILRGMDEASTIELLTQVSADSRLYSAARQLKFARKANDTDLIRRIMADLPEGQADKVSALASMDAAEQLTKRNEILREQDALVKQLMLADPTDRPRLIQALSRNQIYANFLTYEATIAPGAMRQIALKGSTLGGLEAVGAVESHFADALHIVAEMGGGPRAAKRYELHKYILRMAGAAEQIGQGKNPKLLALIEISNPISGKGGNRELSRQLSTADQERVYRLLTDFYFESIGDMRKQAAQNPHLWGQAGELYPPAGRQSPVPRSVWPLPTSAAGSARRAMEESESD